MSKAAVNASETGAPAVPALFSRVAHDLNNCLARINGKAELALMLDKPDRFRPALEEVLDAGQRASVLVADFQRLLSWQGLRTNGAEPVPLADALAVAARLSRLQDGGDRPRVVTAGGATRVAPATAARLVAALHGLLAEALEHAPEGASCRLEAAEREGGWLVTLTIPGLRIPLETRSALERAQRTGELLPGGFGTALAELRAAGAAVRIEGDRIRIEG